MSADTAGRAIRPHAKRTPPRATVWRWVVLGVGAIYFIGPLVAAISFTLQGRHGGLSLSAYRDIFAAPQTGQVGFTTALVYSLEIAVATIVVTMALMLPTQLLLHLRLPRWRGAVEILTLLPLVFPPVVYVVGISDVYTWSAPATGHDQQSWLDHVLIWIRQPSHPLLLVLVYVVLAMPFVYRSLDSGLRAVDVRTLVEAARNLGAGWPTVLLRVLAPCLRTAIVNAAFLCFALVMGEFTIAVILLYNKTFPVWLASLPTTSGHVQAAVSVFSLILVEALLLLIGALNWRRTPGKNG